MILKKIKIFKIKNVKISLFFVNYRGLNVLNYLLKKKLNITHVFLSKRNLNNKIINKVKKTKITFDLIRNLKNKKVYKHLKYKTDLGIICGFPHIFNKSLIDLCSLGILNCHAGKLPEYRGGSPLNWQIINNEKYIGISVIKIDSGIDTGDIVTAKKFRLLKRYNIKDVHQIVNRRFPILVHNSIKKIVAREKLIKQNNKYSKYYNQRTTKDSEINFKKMNAKELDCFTRALNDPYPNAYFYYKNRIIKVQKIKIKKINLKPKEVRILDHNFYVGCKKGAVKLVDYKIKMKSSKPYLI